MYVARIHTLDGPSSVRVDEVPDAVAEVGKVLIRVRAASLTFPEVLQSHGRYQIKPELPFVPGSQVAGEVVDAPEDSGLRAGDRVAGFVFLGGLAELAVADLEYTFALPAEMSFDEACTIPLNYFTSHVALKHRGRLAPGESVLVHGAAGGVGSAAVQTARSLGAGRIVAVVSSEAKAAAAHAAGADECVPAESFREAVVKTGTVDVIVDPVGGDRFTDSLRCLSSGGRLLVVGFAEGSIPEVKVNRLLLNNTEVVGVSWGGYARPRPGFVRQQWDEIVSWYRSGTVRPVLAAVHPLDRVAAGLYLIETRSAIGTVVIRP